EEEEGAGDADVLPVGDEGEVLGGRVAGEVADADVDDGGDDGHRQQAEGGHLLPPRPAQADGPAQGRAIEGRGRRPPPAARALVGPVAAVVDGAAGAHPSSTGAGGARWTNTSSSDVSRLVRRWRGRPRSATTSRMASRSASEATVTSSVVPWSPAATASPRAARAAVRAETATGP